jgi:hypothetical protein
MFACQERRVIIESSHCRVFFYGHAQTLANSEGLMQIVWNILIVDILLFGPV